MYQLTQIFETLPSDVVPFDRLEWLQTNATPCLFLNNRIVYLNTFIIQIIPGPEVDTTILIGIIPYPGAQQIGVWDKNGNALERQGPTQNPHFIINKTTYNLLIHRHEN